METKDVIIINAEKSIIISDILRLVTETNTHNLVVSSIKTERIEGRKGTILIEIAVGIASSALYDLLKKIVNRMSQRRDYNPDRTITINFEAIALRDILKK